MAKIRQIDLPEDVRAKFPASLGTLKHIKVLTNDEFAELQSKKVYRCKAIVEAQRTCIYHIKDNIVTNFYIRRLYVCAKKKTEKPQSEDCEDCKEHQTGIRWHLKRRTCSHFIKGKVLHRDYDVDDPETARLPYKNIIPGQCLMKFTEVTNIDCGFCQEYLPRSAGQIYFNIAPINTGDILIPTIHYRLPPREKVDYSELS